MNDYKKSRWILLLLFFFVIIPILMQLCKKSFYILKNSQYSVV